MCEVWTGYFASEGVHATNKNKQCSFMLIRSYCCEFSKQVTMLELEVSKYEKILNFIKSTLGFFFPYLLIFLFYKETLQ